MFSQRRRDAEHAQLRTSLRLASLRLRSLVGMCLPSASPMPLNVAAEAVLKDLHQPCGVAVRPGGTADRYEVFIAESGAGRIVRWSTHRTEASTSRWSPASTSQADVDPLRTSTGRVALWFLDPGLLVVGTTRDAGRRPAADVTNCRTAKRVLTADATTGDRTRSASEFDGVDLHSPSRVRGRTNSCRIMLVLAVRDADGRARLLKARVQAGHRRPAASRLATAKRHQSPRAVATSTCRPHRRRRRRAGG